MEKNLNPGTQPTGGQPGNSKPERTFTKEEVNQLMQRRIDKSHNAFYKRYGVKDLSELDSLFGQAKGYEASKQQVEELNQKYGDLEGQHKDLIKRYGYKVCNINDQKINDIETYFKGKGIDISEESLMNELKTHPDWVNKPSTIEHLGVETTPPPPADEAVIASQIFGVDLTN